MNRSHAPNRMTLEKIARALDVPIERFFDLEDESPLDGELRRRLETSLQALMKRMPTISRVDARDEIFSILSGLYLE